MSRSGQPVLRCLRGGARGTRNQGPSAAPWLEKLPAELFGIVSRQHVKHFAGTRRPSNMRRMTELREAGRYNICKARKVGRSRSAASAAGPHSKLTIQCKNHCRLSEASHRLGRSRNLQIAKSAEALETTPWCSSFIGVDRAPHEGLGSRAPDTVSGTLVSMLLMRRIWL